MIGWNKESGWGRSFLNSFPARGQGKVFFVCKSTDTVNFNKLQSLVRDDPDGDVTLFTTFAAAISASNTDINWSGAPWAVNHTIYVFPGEYAENITALPYGAYLIGLGDDVRDPQLGVKIKPASGDAIDVDACINCNIENIGFESVDTAAAFDAAICNNVRFKNCFFTGAAEATTAVYGFWTSDCTKTSFEKCWFCNADNGVYFHYTDANDGVNYLHMKDCLITGCSAAGVYTNSNLVGPHSVIEDTVIVGGGQTLAIGVDDNAGVLSLSRLDITATDPVQGCRDANGCYGNGTLLNGSGE